MRFMEDTRPIWLVNNTSSGSNDDEALAALEQCCGRHGFRVAHRTTFPAQDLPTPAILDAAGIDRVAVFAGDGTINSLLGELSGWGGAVLVLPGGTMNLLFHRLHGEREMEEVVAAVASGNSVMHRPSIIRCDYGDAYAGLLAGPGTSWNQVREAMRKTDIAELAGSTVAAIQETLGGEMIACVEPAMGRKEGYPLLEMEPTQDGIEIAAYYAESPGEYLEQGLALLKRNFREGPHEVLGRVRKLRVASTEGNPFGVLIDGEPAGAAPDIEFALATCEVDLIATEGNGI
jgi:diacylglycerol kinase family enzyme